MQTITRDTVKNRVTVTMEGSFDGEEAEQAVAEGIAAYNSMRPGFDVVVDMTGLQASKEEAAAQLAHSKEALVKAGVNRVVRIDGGSTLASMQVSRAGVSDYEVITAGSVEEAHALLDEN